MISRSPEIIAYNKISSSFTNGETVETKTIVSGIKCSVQSNSQSYKTFVNGSDIVYKFQIMITGIAEIKKISSFNIDDTVTFSGNDYKVISGRRRQKHIEIYI